MLYRVDPHISLAVNKNWKELLSGSPFSQIIKMLSHSKHVVSFAPCTCVQASTLHSGTKTTYRLTNSQLSCLLYDSCSEENFKQVILFYRDNCKYTRWRNPFGFFCFFFFTLSSVFFFKLTSMLCLYVLNILLDEINLRLQQIYKRDFKNEKR